MIRELSEQELKQRALLNDRLNGRKPKDNFDDCANPLLDEDNPFLREALGKNMFDNITNYFKDMVIHAELSKAGVHLDKDEMKELKETIEELKSGPVELLPPPGSGLRYTIDKNGYIHCEECEGDD